MKKQFQSKSVPRGTRTIWRYLGALFILFTFAIGNVWAADNVFTFPTSGTITTQKSHSITGTGTACIDGNKIYYESNQSYAVSTDYGMEANKLGVAFKPTQDCQLSVKYGSNSTSARTITSNFYQAADPRLYQLFVDAADVDKGVSKYVLDNYTSDYSWWKDQGLIKYSSNKYQEDAGNGAKAMSGETAKTGLRTAWFSNTALTITAKSNATKVIEAADTTVIFRANQEYFIYATRNSSGVGYMQFNFAPVYTITLNLDGGAFTTTPDGWKVSGGNYTKLTPSTELPTPTKDGKDFDGWMNPSSEKVESPYAPSSAITLTAKWKNAAPRYAISYDKGEYGTGEIAGGEKTEGVAYTLSSERFTRSGYVQVGWATTDGGVKAYDLGGSYTTDAAQEFFPVWAEKETYTAAFECATVPAGWTFANAGYTNTSATAAYVCTFKANEETTASGKGMSDDYIAFAKNAGAIATYDLGYATTVSSVVSNIIFGSTKDQTGTFEYLAADGTTVLHSFTVAHSKTDWGSNAVNHMTEVPNVQYIRVKGTSGAWMVMSAFSVTYGSLVTKYNVSFDKNDEGASGSQATLKYAEGAEVTLPACTFEAPEGKEFDAWISDDVTISNNKFTMPNKAVAIKATWKALVAKYTVHYVDGTTSLGDEIVDVGEYPKATGITTEKDFYTFAAWQKDAADIALDDAFWATVAKDAEVTLTARYTPAYATSINIEQWVLDNKKDNSAFRALLTSLHYEYANLNDLDSLTAAKNEGDRNEPYLGQKWKLATSEISFLLKSGSTLRTKFGNVSSNVNVVLGNAEPVEKDQAALNSFEYTAAEDIIVKLKGTGTGTVVVKQIMIDEPIADVVLPAIVTLDANGGTYADATVKYTGAALVIGDATPADEDQVFAGWFDGEDQIDASAYVPTKNVTLVAHYANKPYTVTYVGGEGATGSMAPVDVAWGEDYTALACGFEKENHSFVNWAVTGVTGITEIAAGSAFVMPKGNVTLTAQWVNEALVARIGENYYESLPAAVAAATDGQTVYLLKDVAAGPGVMIESANAKNITIDFGGFTYIVSTPAVGSTNTKTQGFHFEQGCTITMQNGTIGSTGDEVKMLVQNYCDLTLLNIKLDGTDLAGTGRYTLSNNCGNVVIGNGAEIVAQAGGVAFDVCYYASYPSVSVTVLPGASIDGKIEMSMSNNKQGVEENCQLIITGGEFENFSIDHSNIPEAKVNAAISAGTFDAKVENLYCAEGFVPSDADAVTGKYTVEPKDGVCIIKANVGDDTFVIDEEASLFAGTASKNNVRQNSSTYQEKTGWKFQSRPAHLGLTLSGDETFQEGDVVEVFVTSVADISGNNDKMRIFDANEATAAHLLYESEADMVQGVNRIILPATTTKSLYLHRTKDGAYDNFNPFVAYVAVYRPMMPKLTAITIDGRDGVINEANKTVAVQIPYEANLANLTIASTVVRNAAHATTPEAVISNEGAWVIGDNTYRVMDKDGDYTDYTITLTRDQLKHAVRFMDGEEVFASTLVVDGESPVAPATDPEKEDYLFQGWAETVDGDVITDWSAISISAAKDFYAKWVSDGAIKLLNGSTVNHEKFITGVTASTVTISSVEYDCVTFNGGVGEHVNNSNIKNLNRHVSYNATTTQTKVKLSLYNSNGNNRTIYVKGVVEGSTEEEALATIQLAGNEQKTTEWIEFNNAKNRTIYIFVSGNAGDIKILQEKIIESGDALKMAGEAGYSINLNKGRWFGAKQTDLSFEGMGYNLSSDYTTLSSTAAKLKSSSFVFDVNAPVTLQVTSSDNKTYYVTKGSAGTDNPTAKNGLSEFDLTVGKWYITAGSSEAPFTNIAFIAPRCEKPTITTQPATKQTFGPGNLTATVVATVSDGGTLKYQWYKAADDSKVDGATEATLTTTTEGAYYVIVTNTLVDHSDNSVKSESATLGYRVTNDATLSALSASEGTLDPTFAKDVLEYRVDLPEGTVDVPTLSATATMAGYAEVVIFNEGSFDNYEATSTVTVTSEDGTANKTYTVKFYVDHQLPQVDVTESTTWDWTYAAEGEVTIKVTGDTEPIKKNQEGLMANVRVGENKPTNDATFNSQALLFYGENVRAKDGGRFYASIGHIKFNVTKPGIVEVEYSSNTDNKVRSVKINGFVSPTSNMKADIKTFKVYVPAGEVTLMGVEGNSENAYLRISKITYTVKETPDYERTVSNNIGTLCVEHNVLVGGAPGATFYQIASRNKLYDYKIDFEEVLPNEELKAGEPYIFQSTTGKIELFFSETTSNVDPIEVRGMIGNYEATTLAITEENMSTTYYFAQNKLWNCEDLVESGLKLNEHRAYIDFTKVPTYADYEASKQQQQNNAPRRRVSLVMNGQQVATGIENGELINGENGVQKVLINGKLFILRGEKMYDVTGKLVK